ncbi:hypothetical protein NMY22_g14316 [Coprinellus aureogranulatus]|nr:hypothetical protein NMY22_g14316 [Coprinellus aureogranulatus]
MESRRRSLWQDADEEVGEITAREILELYEREPIFGKIFRGIKKVGGAIFGRELNVDELAELAERDFEDLEEIYERGRRSGRPNQNKFNNGNSMFFRSVDPIDDLEAREPLFWLAAKAIGKVAGKVAGHKHKRSLEDLEDYLEARDFDDEDLFLASRGLFKNPFGRPAGWKGILPFKSRVGSPRSLDDLEDYLEASRYPDSSFTSPENCGTWSAIIVPEDPKREHPYQITTSAVLLQGGGYDISFSQTTILLSSDAWTMATGNASLA